jgi:uncharacterized surface protein with fasciclin (FAS1) repeats
MKKNILSHLLTMMLLGVTSMGLRAQTVVDVIVNSPDHDTLEAAVVAAGLADDLSGEGPFTVFAPTDAAFKALPAGTIDTLLSDPTGDLANILLYHVVEAKALSTDLSDGQELTTLLGKKVNVTINDDGVFINDAKVTVADIEADNGVVHVIDAVLLPPAITVVDIIVNSPDHDTLEAAVVAAGLADDLSGEGPFTVFAPTDAAFKVLPAGTIDTLLSDPTGDLANILLYHVIGAKALSTDLSDGQELTTLLGKKVNVTINDDGVFINDAKVTMADIEADNGVVHVIDAVLIPSLETGVFNGPSVKTVIVFPNPAVNRIKLIGIEGSKEGYLKIYSLNGAIVYDKLISNFNDYISLNGLQSGSYVLTVETKSGRYTQKIMIK